MDPDGRATSRVGREQAQRRPAPWNRLLAALILAALTLLPSLLFALPHTYAGNIRKVVRVTVGPKGIPAAAQELDLDLGTPGGGLASYTVPPGEIVQFTIRAIIDQSGGGGLLLVDEDTSEAVRSWDDVLAEGLMPQNLNASGGDTVTFTVQATCGDFAEELRDGASSGESSAEIYLLGGETTQAEWTRVPLGPNAAQGDMRGSFWRIDCGRSASVMMGPAGGSIDAPWGGELTLPAGALSSPTNVQMGAMSPLLDEHAIPNGYQAIASAVVLQPTALSLAAPATLVLRYQRGEVGDIADASTLQVFRHDASAHAWTLVPGAVVNTTDQELSISIAQFGTYGIAAVRPELAPLSLQAVATSHGDNTLGDPKHSEGSELDVLRAAVSDGWLYLYFGGNLNSSQGHRLNIFLDTEPGGQNRLLSNSNYTLGLMGDSGFGNGLRFDAGFAPDHWFQIRLDQGGFQVDLAVEHETLPTSGQGQSYWYGWAEVGSAGVLTSAFNLDRVAARVLNSNIAGVPAGCEAPTAADVPTGMEIAIPLRVLGATAGCVRLCAFVFNGWVSNQVLGPLPAGTCGPFFPRSLNFEDHAGLQYVEICSTNVVSVPPTPVAPNLPRLIVRPNPSHGAVTIELGDWSPGDWSVEIFDLAGRRVQRFHPTAFHQGRLLWAGETLSGAQAAGGLYMARLRRGGTERTVRFLRLP